MPRGRKPVDTDLIRKTFEETQSGRETARRLGIHENTVYQRLRSLKGVCVDCANSVLPGQKHCAECLKRLRERQKIKRKELVRKALCVECQAPKAHGSMLYCDEHRLAHLDRNTEYKGKVRKSTGDTPNIRQRERSIRDKYGEEVLGVWRSYGGKCAICSALYEDAVIHIHHIDNNNRNNTAENVVPLCFSCHMLVTRIHNHPQPYKVFETVQNWFPSSTQFST